MMKLVVLYSLIAAAAASAPFYVASTLPLVRSFPYSAPLLQPYNYRGPLSLAPGQSAEVLGADGRPLDTLEVNADRLAHFTAKTGLHLLKKRSVTIINTPYTSFAAAPIVYSAPLLQPYNYRGPLSLAPGQPAEILGADGRPLDTLEVNQDRAAHFAAKTGLHLLKKRSAPLLAAPLPIAPYAARLGYVAPIAHVTPYIRPISYTAPIIHAF